MTIADIKKTAEQKMARSIEALKKAGLLAAVSGVEAGGLGLGIAGAAAIVRRVAQECASTAMVLCMPQFGTIEQRNAI